VQPGELGRVSRMVLLSPFTPSPDGRHGGVRSIRGLARALAERHELVLVHVGSNQDLDPDLARRCLHVTSVDPLPRRQRTERLRRTGALARGRTVWSADPATAAMAEHARIAATRFKPDVVQAEYGRLGSALATVGGEPLRVVTIHEPAASQPLEPRSRAWRAGMAKRLDARAALREQRRMLTFVDAAVVFSEEDRTIVEHGAPTTTEVAVIPLATDIPCEPLCAAGADPPAIIFVGNFWHPPNVDAALRLGRSIFPLVKGLHPEATLDIVGDGPPEQVRELASDSVRVTGAVPDLTELLDRAAVVAAPIAIGGGSRVKVLDALAAGKAVVTTSRGAAGLTVPAGEAIVIAEHDGDFASAITRLLSDRNARLRLGRRARAWAEQELMWSTMAERYGDLYARLAEKRQVVEPHRQIVGAK
jgi:glycosyltransferase involved in cell wall biosynthesis